MDYQNTQGAPDSWDMATESGTGDKNGIAAASKKFAELNVDAAEFIPGQNVFAASFVPSTVTCQTQQPAAADSTQTNGAENMDVDVNHTSIKSSAATTPDSGEDPPDDWENNKVMENGETEEDDEGESDGSNKPTAVTVKRKKPEKEIVARKKDHLNIVFIGHVDAGKSTISGHLLYLTGMVDKRTLEKYEREAKEKNRETWYLSWALDTNQEERDKGKTVEVGRAAFETDHKHFTILDAPGHKSFVPNMIGGASQADVAVLVISARRGEFETGFDRGGQTREHAMLVKTAGVKRLIVVVNKMDDPTVKWDKERYDEIQEKLTPYLRKCGFNPKTDIFYLPVSGLSGANLRALNPEQCSWYSGKSLIDYLDSLPPVSRMSEAPLRLPIVDRYKDMGTIVLGKIESGTIMKGQTVSMMPNKIPVEVLQLWSNDDEVDQASPGENVKCKLRNVEEEDVSPGFVLCPVGSECLTGRVFDAKLVILEHKSIICAGYSAVMHLHTSAEEVTIKALICTVDKNGEKSKSRPRFVKQDQIAIMRLEVTGGIVCIEPFNLFPQMGRFTLRDEGKTIAIGKVLKVIA